MRGKRRNYLLSFLKIVTAAFFIKPKNNLLETLICGYHPSAIDFIFLYNGRQRGLPVLKTELQRFTTTGNSI